MTHLTPDPIANSLKWADKAERGFTVIRGRPERPIVSADHRPMAFRLTPAGVAALEKHLADKAADTSLIGRLKKFLGR